MPRTTQNPKRSATAASPGQAAPRTSPPAASAGKPPLMPVKQGALFRALVGSGCDPDAAYNAEVEVRSMAAENLVAQLGAEMRVGFLEVKQLCRENADRLAEHSRETAERLAEHSRETAERLAEHSRETAERFAEHGRKLDALAEAGAERDRKLEFLAVRTDALRTEIRLVWGALGILVTVLLAVFGLLFTR